LAKLVRRPQTLRKQLEPHSPLGWAGALAVAWLAVIVLTLILFLGGYVPTPEGWDSLVTGGPGWPSALVSVSLLAAWLLSILYAVQLSGRAVVRTLGWWLAKVMLVLTERTGNEVLLQLVPGSRVTERELAHHAGIYLPHAGRDPVTLFVRKLRAALHSLELTDVVIVSAEYRLSAIELRLLADHHEAERLLLFEKRLIAQLGEGGVLRRAGPELLLTVWGITEPGNLPATASRGDSRAELVPLCLLPASRLRGPSILHVNPDSLGHTLVASQDRRLAEHLLAGLVLRVREVYHPNAPHVCILGNREPVSSERQYGYRRSEHLVAISDLGAGIMTLDEAYAELQARQDAASGPERPDILLILREASELDWNDERIWALSRSGLSHGICLLATSTSPQRLESSCLDEFTTKLIIDLPDREQRGRLLDPEGLYRWFRSRDGIEIRTRVLGYRKGKSLPPPRRATPPADAADSLAPELPATLESDVPAQSRSQSPETTRLEADEDSVSRPSSPGEQRGAAPRVENDERAPDEVGKDVTAEDGTKTAFPISTPYYVRLFGDFSLERATGEPIKQATRVIIPIELIAYLAVQPGLCATKVTLLQQIWGLTEKDKDMDQGLTSATNDIKAWFERAGEGNVSLIKAGGRGADSPRLLDKELLTSDVRRFRQAVGYAEEMIGKQPEEAMACLREAIDLYRDDFMPGLTRDWAVEVRQQLRRELIRALQKLIALCEESGRCREDVEALRRRLVDARQRHGMR
jgi:hypothetical protein